ncbi:TnsA-like heteromeric transposase endonuclease subunit [Streptomyces hirsutus]|uniref:TnsA-like heteromeric transposase endonuclease subunit n=1 Tax=Streptomyces hirsutus TaxID=35620 RepID=UPI003326A99F
MSRNRPLSLSSSQVITKRTPADYAEALQGAGWNRARARQPEVDSVDVLFRAAGGAKECSRWSSAAAEVVFESCPPLKPFPVRKGKRLAPGWWWSATTGKLVHYGSAAMRLHVMLLDRDPRISGLAARSLELRWHRPSGVPAHAPQLMLRLADGQGVLAGCTGRGELSRRQRSLAAAVGEVCTAAGWRYWVGPVDPVPGAQSRFAPACQCPLQH